MLPGIIGQVSLEWNSSVDYYLPTLKQHNGKIYVWKAASGPHLGGPRPPGPDSPNYWEVLDLIVAPRTSIHEEEDWDLMTMDGKFLIRTTQGVSHNPPQDITAWWWLEVSSCELDGKLQVLQVARLHEVGVGGVAKVLARVYDGTTWGLWSYNYSQYSG